MRRNDKKMKFFNGIKRENENYNANAKTKETKVCDNNYGFILHEAQAA